MNLFGGKKTITVSSTLYNMAGPEEDRTNYLKGTLFAAVLEDVPSLGDSITKSYRDGPGIKLRQFFNYAVAKDLEGLPETAIGGASVVDHATVAAEITVSPSPVGLEIAVQKAQISQGDFEAWIYRWVAENHASRITEDWVGDYDPDTDSFSVQFPNGDFFSFNNTTSPIYDREKDYVVAQYFEYLDDNTQPIVEGAATSVTSKQDVSSYSAESSSGTSTAVTLQRERTTVWSYSDSTPDNTVEDGVDADVSADLNTSVDVYEKTTMVGTNGLETEGLFERLTYTGTDSVVGGYTNTVVTTTDVGGGVTRTETSTTTGEQVSVSWDEEYDTQVIYEGTVIGGEQMFIYEIGTGNANLDALMTDEDASGFQEFFPLLPLRINNVALDNAAYDANGLYEETKKAYRRATNLKSIDTLLDDIADNPDIADIDYAYIKYGCALNVRENAARKYIYEFMKRLIPYQQSDSSTITDFQTRITQYESDLTAYESWETNQGSGLWVDRTDRPAEPVLELPPISSFQLYADSTLMPSYDFRIMWVHLDETSHSGTFTRTDLAGNPAANKGEVLIKKGSDITWRLRTGVSGFGGVEYEDQVMDTFEIYYQISDSIYQKITAYGMSHHNYIYGGKSVYTGSSAALDDADVSGFIIPLHYPTMISLGIVDYTQLSTACVHIVFNSYEVVKQKWYESFLFKILIMVAILIVAVLVFPSAFAGGGGILGGNAALGSAFGLTGTSAILAGVLSNYLASIIVSQVLQFVVKELFGDKWGALIAAIIGFALNAATSGLDIFSAKGLMELGGALANGYAGFVQGEITELQDDLKVVESDYEKQMKYINDLIHSLGLNEDLNFNPLFLTDSVYGNDSRKASNNASYLPESADEFIRRTTMTGSDVVDLSLGMVYDFNEINTTLPRN